MSPVPLTLRAACAPRALPALKPRTSSGTGALLRAIPPGARLASPSLPSCPRRTLKVSSYKAEKPVESPKEPHKSSNGANPAPTPVPVAAAAATPAKTKKPRLPYLDSLRFFLIAYIATGHFISFASPSPFVAALFSQVNVVVGAFFVLSGYVAGYVATELDEYKASPRIKPAVGYFVGRVAGYFPLYALVNIIFAPMFLWVDSMYNGPVKAAFHAVVTMTLSQAWFPSSAELWNAPTWFLSALTFAMLVLPYALPYVAEWRKKGLKTSLFVLTGIALLAKVAFTYDINGWEIFEGMTAPKAHPNHLLWNTQRFHPFYAVLEVLMGAVASRLVMTDNASKEDEQPEGSSPASALLPLVGMVGLIVARAAGWVTMNDGVTRCAFFIPLFIMFLVRMHRRAVHPSAASEGPGLVAGVLSNPFLCYLGALSFPIYILHGPIGQVFYKKVVATKLWGGVMSQVAGPWFFAVYWAVVIAAAALVNKFFINNEAVQNWTNDSVKAITKRLT